MGWTEFSVVLALFLGTHFLPSLRTVREKAILLLGRRAYFALYGAVSTVFLVWLIVAAARAPYVPILDAADWQRWVPNVVMPPAVLLLALGFRSGYPYTLGGSRGGSVDAAQPGLAALTRHPMLWALVLWAAAHLAANPDVAHVILFGLFLAVSLASMRLFDRRGRAAETTRWPEILAATSLLSLRPLADPQFWRANGRGLALRVVAGAILYATLYHLHAPVIGVSPRP